MRYFANSTNTHIGKNITTPLCLWAEAKTIWTTSSERVYLHPHVPAMFLQFLPHLLSSKSGCVQNQMLPLDWLEDMRVMRHVQADLHLREEDTLKHSFHALFF